MSSPPEAASPPHVFASVWGQAEVLTPHVLQRGTFVSTPNGDVISILFDQATPEPGTLHSPPASPPGQPASPPDSGVGRTVGSPPGDQPGSPPTRRPLIRFPRTT
ncbi:MAG: hypothetical protein QOG00_3243 [Pyrinomonadaceae bacterium]|nr:hypothetical protein [Pyrinomonadaceae bacterium]